MGTVAGSHGGQTRYIDIMYKRYGSCGRCNAGIHHLVRMAISSYAGQSVISRCNAPSPGTTTSFPVVIDVRLRRPRSFHACSAHEASGHTSSDRVRVATCARAVATHTSHSVIVSASDAKCFCHYVVAGAAQRYSSCSNHWLQTRMVAAFNG